MQTISIDVNNEAVGFVKGLGFMSMSEYVNLTLANQMMEAKTEEDELEELHKLLDEGDASGYVPVDEKFFADMKLRFEKIRQKYV